MNFYTIKIYNQITIINFLFSFYFLETLRLYPPVATIHRQSAIDYNLPNGSIMPAGTRLLIPVLGFHRDADVYPNPLKFDPNRFSETEKSKRNSFYFLPFGEGPRGCIAMRYGFLQTKLVLALLLKNYQFNVCDQTVIPLKVNSLGLVHVPKGPIWLNLEAIGK
jgi:cytochrome P450 family 6